MFVEVCWDVQKVHLQRKKGFPEKKWFGCAPVHLRSKKPLKILALVEDSVVLGLEGGSSSTELPDVELNAVLLFLLTCL